MIILDVNLILVNCDKFDLLVISSILPESSNLTNPLLIFSAKGNALRACNSRLKLSCWVKYSSPIILSK